MRIAGFPSPADEYGLVSLSLTELLVPRPASTYFVRVAENLTPAIVQGDILVVDRSLVLKEGSLAVIVLRGQLALRRARRRGERWWFDSLRAPERAVTVEEDDLLWGVVSYVLHRTA